MATNDVPGANPANNDTLRVGCWAEHKDGSLMFVKSAEGGRVIYDMFDLAGDVPVQYTDAMPEDGFKTQFSYNPSDPNSIEWTWHDKTGFPWDRVIKQGARDGMGFASAQDQLSAAARVAASLALRGKNIDLDDYRHLVEQVTPAGRGIVAKLQKAIGELPTDDKKARKQRKILEKAQKRLKALG